MAIKRVGLIGVGLVGSGWAAFFAAGGLAVKLYDADRSACENGRMRALDNLKFLRSQNIINALDLNRAEDAIEIADSMKSAVENAQFIQESVAERYEAKKAVFKDVDRYAAPDAILASSSSGLLISELQQVMRYPERSLIAHPFNPPHLIPLVELVPGKMTAGQTMDAVKTFFSGLGKVAVVLNREVPGHIANRLQAAVWREAIDLVTSGVASVGDVDKALSAGPGLRWALMGQHMIFHLGGGDGGIEYFIDHVGESFQALWKDMATWTAVPSQAKDLIAKGTQTLMQGKSSSEIGQWRDEMLVQLGKLLARGVEDQA